MYFFYFNSFLNCQILGSVLRMESEILKWSKFTFGKKNIFIIQIVYVCSA